MFNLGIPEILFILLIAALILGPDHMPEAARRIGRWSAKMRSAATSFTQAVSSEEDVKEVREAIRDLGTDLRTAKSEASSLGTALKTEGTALSQDLSDQTHTAYEAAKEALRQQHGETGRSHFMQKPLGKLTRTLSEPTTSVYLNRPENLDENIKRCIHEILDRAPSEGCKVHQHVALARPLREAAFLRYRALARPQNPQASALRHYPMSRP